MADSKLSTIYSNNPVTTPDGDELVYIIDDPSGTPEDAGITVDDLISGAQPLDADLTALAGISSNGLLTHTGAGTASARTVTGTSNEVTVTNGDGVSGNPTLSLPSTIDLGGKTSFEIPNSATPTVDANGEIAVDTTVTDFSHGLVKYYSGEEVTLIGMPSGNLTSPTDGYVVKYNGTNDEFELAADTGGGGGGTPGGSNTQVQFNDSGGFGGDAGMVYNKTTDTMTLGNLSLTNDLPVTEGGTGASDAAGARTSLGLVIGTNVQAFDADLTTLSTSFASASASGPASLALFEDTDNGTNKATIIAPASMASDRTLTLPDATDTLVGKATTDTFTNKTIDANGTGNSISNIEVADFASGVVDTDLTSVSGSDDTIPSAKATKTALDLKQTLDSDLTTIAGLTATTDNFIQSKSSAWASRTPTQVTADLIAVVGDSGSGGTKGLVPAPGAGDAAAGKFLKADGTFAVPAGGGSSTPSVFFDFAYTTVMTGNTSYSTAGTFTSGNNSSWAKFSQGGANSSYGYTQADFGVTAFQPAGGFKKLRGHMLICSTNVASDTGTGYLKFYSNSAASALNAVTANHIGLKDVIAASSSTTSSTVGNGSTGTTTTLSSSAIYKQPRVIGFNQSGGDGTDVTFYVDGTSKNVHSSNQPTIQSGSQLFGMHMNDSGAGTNVQLLFQQWVLAGDMY